MSVRSLRSVLDKGSRKTYISFRRCGNREKYRWKRSVFRRQICNCRQLRSRAYASKKPYTALTKGSQLTAQKSDSLAYGAGDRVRHVKFGEGTVLDIKEGGRDFEVTVEFGHCGRQKNVCNVCKISENLVVISKC